MTLDDLVQEYVQLGQDALLLRYPPPVLISLGEPGAALRGDFHTQFGVGGSTPAAGAAGATGVFAALPDLSIDDDRREVRGEDEVFFVAKRPGAPFPERIGIGRARNADVSVPLPQLSKYHAFFTWSDARDECFLTDAGSRNGTFVDGVRLVPREPCRLHDDADIRFGNHGMRFFLHAGLCTLLQERAR